jgi:outer membrane protein assembly factor BamB
MKPIMTIITIYCILFWSSCIEPITPLPEIVPIDSSFYYVWNVPLGLPNHEYQSDNCIVYKENVIVPVDETDNTLIVLDKKSGKKSWEYNFNGSVHNSRGFAGFVQKNNILIGSNILTIFSFDLDTRQLIWGIDLDGQNNESCDSDMTIIGDYVYTTIELGGPPFFYKTTLARFNIYTGVREDLVTEPQSNGVNFYNPPAFYLDPESGDSILIYKVSFLKINEGITPCDLVAYNLSKRHEIWRHKAFSPATSSENTPSNVYGSSVLVVSFNELFKYDIMTGELEWKTIIIPSSIIGNVVRSSFPVLFNDRIYIQGTEYPFVCIDAIDGHIVWTNPKGSITPSNRMIIHKDMIINTSWGTSAIRGYDLQTGHTFLSERNPNSSTFAAWDIVYDNETDTYYTQDFKNLMAFKIRKP